jgi:hypothetical protein
VRALVEVDYKDCISMEHEPEDRDPTRAYKAELSMLQRLLLVRET